MPTMPDMVKDVQENVKGNMKWEDRHTVSLPNGSCVVNDRIVPQDTADVKHTLQHALIEHLLTSRPAFYHLRGLDGEVDGHGGNRISQKIIETCKKLARDAGMDVGVVQDIIDKGKATKAGRKRERDGPEGSPKKSLKRAKQEKQEA